MKMAEKERLVELLRKLAAQEGISQSILNGVQFMRANNSYPRAPVIYDQRIVIVGQGRKKGYLGDQVYTYGAYNYLVLAASLPFECETEASPEKPLLAVSIQVSSVGLGELLVDMDGDADDDRPAPLGIYSTPLTDAPISATVRLLECLCSPMDSRILGPQIVREITYRVLCGEQGGALRALATRHSSFGQIARVLRRIHSEYSNALDVETLAEDASMSVSTFHRTFKAVTATSPLQYLKSIRLHKARLLMLQEGLNAGTAAARVGYESASQFSREFKRFFGNSPVVESAKMRGMERLLPTLSTESGSFA